MDVRRDLQVRDLQQEECLEECRIFENLGGHIKAIQHLPVGALAKFPYHRILVHVPVSVQGGTLGIASGADEEEGLRGLGPASRK